jgi:hypothetical protein
MPRTLPTKLDILKQERFDPETRKVRIARALAALDEKPALHLTPDEWKDAAENPGFEEEQ